MPRKQPGRHTSSNGAYNDGLQVIQTARQLVDLGPYGEAYSTLGLRHDGRVEKQMISRRTSKDFEDVWFDPTILETK